MREGVRERDGRGFWLHHEKQWRREISHCNDIVEVGTKRHRRRQERIRRMRDRKLNGMEKQASIEKDYLWVIIVDGFATNDVKLHIFLIRLKSQSHLLTILFNEGKSFILIFKWLLITSVLLPLSLEMSSLFKYINVELSSSKLNYRLPCKHAFDEMGNKQTFSTLSLTLFLPGYFSSHPFISSPNSLLLLFCVYTSEWWFS